MTFKISKEKRDHLTLSHSADSDPVVYAQIKETNSPCPSREAWVPCLSPQLGLPMSPSLLTWATPWLRPQPELSGCDQAKLASSFQEQGSVFFLAWEEISNSPAWTSSLLAPGWLGLAPCPLPACMAHSSAYTARSRGITDPLGGSQPREHPREDHK